MDDWDDWDDRRGSPPRHQRLDYDPWAGPFTRTPPPDDAARQLIRRVLASGPVWNA